MPAVHRLRRFRLLTVTCGRGVVLFIISALIMMTTTRSASAYCQKSTCDDEERCARDEYGCISEGSGLVWTVSPIPYRFHNAGSSRFPDEDAVREAMRRAVRRWEDVTCADGNQTSVRFVEQRDISTKPKTGKFPPMSFGIYFRDNDWPGAKSELAVTHVHRGEETGRIAGAAIEINTQDHTFALDGVSNGNDNDNVDGSSATAAQEPQTPARAPTDLEAVFVHELGHYIGLDHTKAPGSVMAKYYCGHPDTCARAGSGSELRVGNEKSARSGAELRELGADDIAGVCALYPPRRSSSGRDIVIPSSGCQMASNAAAQIRGERFANVVVLLLSSALGIAAIARRRRNVETGRHALACRSLASSARSSSSSRSRGVQEQ